MVTDKTRQNVNDLEQELEWFQEVLKIRAAINHQNTDLYTDVYQVLPPHLNGSTSEYARYIKQHKLGFEERFLLVLSMVPHLKPELLDVFLQKNEATSQVFTEFGGRSATNHNGFLPTGTTALFILAKDNLEKRINLRRYFRDDHTFAIDKVLELSHVEPGEPYMNGLLLISEEALDLFTTGESRRPRFCSAFPAKRITTDMNWDDLILDEYSHEQLTELEIWIKHDEQVKRLDGFKKHARKGLKAVFYGPSGCGKTLAASLLGKNSGFKNGSGEKDVYLCDLAMLTSKYIGDTEKNLSNLFERAQNKNWILVFDEAESLFSHRHNDSSDPGVHHASQVASYLLQRIEQYDGVLILCTNNRTVIDKAFLRRFQTFIHFPMPQIAQRRKLWKQAFQGSMRLTADQLEEMATKYELSGGSIMNAAQYTLLKTIERRNHHVASCDLLGGVQKEYHKMGRTM